MNALFLAIVFVIFDLQAIINNSDYFIAQYLYNKKNQQVFE